MDKVFSSMQGYLYSNTPLARRRGEVWKEKHVEPGPGNCVQFWTRTRKYAVHVL